jgi:peptidoglycan/LPS O-acetylase OafA/YrhL
MERIKALDSLRFICALLVLIGHLGFPLPYFMDSETGTDTLMINLGKVIGLIFNGPAAVICFFIISGFCINFPFRNQQSINLLSYYSRRLLRIGIPAVIALVIYINFNDDFLKKEPQLGVLWSVICEVIYYLIFPILFYIRKFIKWEFLFGIVYLISFLVLLYNLDLVKESNNAYSPSLYLGWLIGLPCWLLGCWLSENYDRFTLLSFKKIWLLRLSMIGIITILRIVKFHIDSPFVSNSFTLNLFSIMACVWIGYEIIYYQNNEPFKSLESAGKWSYSLYLVHPIVSNLLLYFNLKGAGDVILIIVALLLSYTFYLVVEKPSHLFSVFISKQFLARKRVDSLLKI